MACELVGWYRGDKARQEETYAMDQPTPTSKRRSLPAGLLLASADVYAALLLIGLLLRLVLGTGGGVLLLMSDMLSWLLIPALPLVLIMLALRRWPSAALQGVLAALWLWWFGGLFLPANPVRAANGGGTELRVMVFNMGAVLADREPTLALIQAEQPDVIALNEVGEEMAFWLEGDLASEYPYRALYGWGVPGKGLLSRYPIGEESGPFTLNTPMTHLTAVLDVNGQPVRLLIGHPPRPLFELARYYYHPGTLDDVRWLAAQAASQDSPALLVGDFNMTDRGMYYHVMTDAGLTDVFRARGFGLGLTFPVWERYGFPLIPPLVRIDYAFATPQITPLRAWVGPDTGSDHLPLFVDVLVTP